VAIQVAEIFSGDIDFHRALRKGDRFSVVYETLEGDGEPLRNGRVLSAEFVNSGKTHQALWFRRSGGAVTPHRVRHYTMDGQSLAARLPGVAHGVLPGHQRLQDAFAPDLAEMGSASGRRLRRPNRNTRCAVSVTARSSLPVCKTALATW